MKFTFAAILAVFLLSGCASTTSQLLVDNEPIVDSAAAQRAVLSLEGKYVLALRVAKAYTDLPLCDKATPPCAKLPVVRAIQKAVPAARAVLDAAQQTVTTSGFGQDVYASSVAAALASLTAFEKITATLK